MAYATTNPPQLLMGAFTAGNGNYPGIWTYASADAASVVRVTGYFSNADDLGMTVGDLILVQDTDTQLTTMHVVLSVTAGGSGDIGDETNVGLNTDSD
jgi:hypothetical protein